MRNAVFNVTQVHERGIKGCCLKRINPLSNHRLCVSKAVKDDTDFADIHRAFPYNFRRTADLLTSNNKAQREDGSPLAAKFVGIPKL